MIKNSKTSYKKGDVLLEEEPFVFALSNKFKSEKCDHCFASNQLLKCTGCSFVHYCNRDCQRKGWSYHKYECSNIKKVAPLVVPDAAKFLARIVIKLHNGGANEKSYYTDRKFRVFRDLMSHYNEIKKDEVKLEHFTCLNGILEKYLEDQLLPNSAELLALYGKMIINSFTILDSEMRSIGIGIYLGASIIDHSCSPNAVAVFEGKRIYIRTLEDLPFLDWSKIYISYIDLLNHARARQKSLKSAYYFLCQCERCLDFDELNCMTSTICQNEDCKSCILGGLLEETSKCPNCNSTISQETKDKMNEIAQFTEEKLEEMKEMAYLDVCRVCLKKQENYFHSMNIYKVRTIDNAWESCIELENWEGALEYGKQLMEPLRKYLGEYHPLRGIFLFKMTKIAACIGRMKEARIYGEEAAKVLLVTHGAKHSLVKENLFLILNELRMT